MEGTVNLSESKLLEMESRIMIPIDESEEVLQNIMDLINGSDAPDDVVCFDIQYLPTVILEILERLSEYESTLEEIREKTY